MVKPAIISISGTQVFQDEKPETIQLVTEGSYSYEPGYIIISYVESQMTGMEGVVTSFTIEEGETVTLKRVGKVNSTMVFRLGEKHESLYDAGFAGLLIGVCARSMTVLLNERGGLFDLSYTVEIEGQNCGTNSYHIEVREAT